MNRVSSLLALASLTLAVASCMIASTEGDAAPEPTPGPARVFGYVESIYGNLPADSLDLRPFTHLIEAFLIPDATGNVTPTNGIPRQAILNEAHDADCLVLVSVGGATVPAAVFSAIAAHASLREQFAANVCAFAENAGYDGIDIDWEFPADGERASYVALVRAFRDRIDAGSWRTFHGETPLLGIGVTTGSRLRGYDFAALSEWVDFAIYFGYDFRNPALGPWSHSADFWPDGYDHPLEASIRGVASEIVRLGMAREKLIVGLPFYTSTGLPWAMVRDRAAESDAPLHPLYLEKWIDGAWVTDAEALGAKVKAVLESAEIHEGTVGGVAIWQLGHQGSGRELTEALAAALAGDGDR